ncbi:MAG: Na+/H+ antiporter [Chloroflexi bacterium]|nr:Na+/H+ antiporter [Chloroflexota bacterium]
MVEIEIILGLLVAVAVLATLARWIGVPYPIPMVLGGLVLTAIPELPNVTIAPDVIFLIFVAPLVFSTAWVTSLRSIRANVRPIGLLSVGLLLVTTVAVAAAVHQSVPDLPWSAAFVLGTLIAPTDTVAASAIARQVGLPGRLVTILEGEGLVDDATGLVAYRMAVAAVLTGTFSIWQAGIEFIVISVGGAAFGLAVGWLVERIWAHLDDPPTEITLSILAPFAAYLPAEAVGVSGVVAVAAAGLYTGWRSPVLLSAATRIEASAVWEVLVFILNGLLFILVGLQLPTLTGALAERPPATVEVSAVLVCLTVIVLRLVWVFPSTYLPRLLSAGVRRRDPAPPWQQVVIMGWTGMRGGDSLAAALAIPFTLPNGAPFPGRDLIIALAFTVIVVTLVTQGLSLPLLIRWLGVREGDASERDVERAHLAEARAALARLDTLRGQRWAAPEILDRLRTRYQHLARHASDSVTEEDEERHDAERRLQYDLIEARRQAVINLRDRGIIHDAALRHALRDLDLEELALEQEEKDEEEEEEEEEGRSGEGGQPGEGERLGTGRRSGEGGEHTPPRTAGTSTTDLSPRR